MTTTGDLSDDFFSAIHQTADTLQCNPQDLLSVMQNESGLRATAHNPNGNASGLIQFMPRILRGLGFNSDPDDTANAADFRAQWDTVYVKNLHQLVEALHDQARYVDDNRRRSNLVLNGIDA